MRHLVALALLAAAFAAPCRSQVSPTTRFGNITFGGYVNVVIESGRPMLEIIRTRGMGTPSVVYDPDGNAPSIELLPFRILAIVDTYCPIDGGSVVHYWNQSDPNNGYGPTLIYQPGRPGIFDQLTDGRQWFPFGGPTRQEYWINQCALGSFGMPWNYCGNPCFRDFNEPVLSIVRFDVRRR